MGWISKDAWIYPAVPYKEGFREIVLKEDHEKVLAEKDREIVKWSELIGSFTRSQHRYLVEMERLKQALAEKDREIQQIREHEFQRGYREGEAAAKGALAEKEREIAKWKAAHDEMVARNRLLRDRPDLPADRIRAHDEWVEKYQRVLAQAVRFASTVEDCNWVANTDEWAAREFLQSPEAQAFLKERPCLARKI